MAASNADTGFGADLLKGNADGPPETFTTLGVEINSISLPSVSRSAIDVSHMASPSEFREYIAGMMDGGEVSLDINFIGAASDITFTALTTGKQSYQILLANSIAWTFDAIVTSYSPTAPLDDKQTASVTFKVSGIPVLTDES